MAEYREFSEKTVSDCITEACMTFSVTSDRLDYEVVSEGSSGLFGIGSKPAVIRARVKEESFEQLEAARAEETAAEKAAQKEQELTPKVGDNVFVRKWMKTKHAIIFRLSNKTIQVIFKDHTEIMLFNDTVTYKNKNNEMSVFKIEDALNSSNFEMNKRIKYTQSILTKMVKVNQSKS